MGPLDRAPAASKIATVGISAFALEALTDLVHVELPEGRPQAESRRTFGEIESVKAVSDLYSPVSGEVIAVHEALAERLEFAARRSLRRRLDGQRSSIADDAGLWSCSTTRPIRSNAPKRDIKPRVK